MALADIFNNGSDPSTFVDENNLRQMSDDSELEKIVKDVAAKNTKAVDDYKKGKAASLQFLAGQVMAATKGRANPETVQKLLKNILK